MLLYEDILILFYFTMNVLYELGQVFLIWYTSVVLGICIYVYVCLYCIIKDNFYILGWLQLRWIYGEIVGVDDDDDDDDVK